MRMSLRSQLTAALATVLIGGGLAVATLPSADAAPVDDLAGIHALRQFSSAAEITGQTANINAALDVPGVVAFAVRFPWNALESSTGVLNVAMLNQSLAFANAHGDELTVRFMAGSHTPDRIKTKCASEMLGTGTARYPRPFSSTGALSTCFLGEYRSFVAQLATWARANGVPEVHLSHYAKDWAEFYYGPEIQSLGGANSAAYMVNATNALVDIGLDYADASLSFELPMSGHGPLMRSCPTCTPGIAEMVTQHIVARVGTGSPLFFIQGNGWDTDGIWGATAATEINYDHVLDYGALLGVQMIQPQQYAWQAVIDEAESKHATYGEIYLDSFNNGTPAQEAALAAAVASFAPYKPGPPPPPSTTTTTTVAPTTTTTVPPTTTTTTIPPTTTTTLPPTTTTTVDPVRTCQARWLAPDGTTWIITDSKLSTETECTLS